VSAQREADARSARLRLRRKLWGDGQAAPVRRDVPLADPRAGRPAVRTRRQRPWRQRARRCHRCKPNRCNRCEEEGLLDSTGRNRRARRLARRQHGRRPCAGCGAPRHADARLNDRSCVRGIQTPTTMQKRARPTASRAKIRATCLCDSAQFNLSQLTNSSVMTRLCVGFKERPSLCGNLSELPGVPFRPGGSKFKLHESAGYLRTL
jgi:hypothetical protein